MEGSKRLHLVLIFAIGYILMAFAWWSVLLVRKNQYARQAMEDKLRFEMKYKGTFVSEEVFKTTPEYVSLSMLHDRQMFMIWGEGSVLFVGLLIGVWFVNRVLQKEIDLTNQRRNFLLAITHELKSPIASIQLVLQTFQKRRLEEAQTQTLTTSALKETDRLNELVNNLLLSAKLDEDYQPHFEEIKVTPILDDLIAKFKMRFPKVEFEFDKKEVPILRGDRQGMISVFTNLIENAVKYSGDNPRISLSQNFINDQFVFDVADNGYGIPTAEKKRVFEKFYRIGNEMTRKAKGTGLGLYIVGQIVKAHHGQVAILDNVPKGTIFRISIPN